MCLAKILTTFTLNNRLVKLTLTTKFSQGVNWCNSTDLPEGWIWLSTCVKNVLFYTILTILAFTCALEFVLLNWCRFWLAPTSPPHNAFILTHALFTFSNNFAQRVLKQEYEIKGVQTEYFKPPEASAYLKECRVLQATVIVMLMIAIMTSVQGISWQILAFFLF